MKLHILSIIDVNSGLSMGRLTAVSKLLSLSVILILMDLCILLRFGFQACSTVPFWRDRQRAHIWTLHVERNPRRMTNYSYLDRGTRVSAYFLYRS